MELTGYQTRALRFRRWLAVLGDTRRASATEALQQAGVDVPADVRNYVRETTEVAGADSR